MHTPLNLNKWWCKPQETFILLKPQQIGITEKNVPEHSIIFITFKPVGSPHFKHEPYGFWDYKKMKFYFSVNLTAPSSSSQNMILMPQNLHQTMRPAFLSFGFLEVALSAHGHHQKQGVKAVASLGPRMVTLAHAESIHFPFQPCRTHGANAGLLPQGDGLSMTPCSKTLELFLSPGEQHLILSALTAGCEALRKRDSFGFTQPKGGE